MSIMGFFVQIWKLGGVKEYYDFVMLFFGC